MKIPFYPNHPDGTYCYQSTLKMVLKHCTGKEYSLQELARETGKLEGKWTWPTTSFLWLMRNGFEIRLMEDFSYEEFANRGKEYLAEHSGQEVADAQEKHSDLPREQKIALQFVAQSKLVLSQKIPTWEDLKRLFKEGYLIICNINANLLFEMQGYSGHFVLLTDINDEKLVLHDPGLPPRPFVSVSKKTFEKAWGYPTERSRNILAIKKEQ
ncbi:MAG: hypothetical protein Q7S68_02545 [Deltaproteobacteria bacterium]|nr:hypothetical protein [Deltaproteobacteria bacterium]